VEIAVQHLNKKLREIIAYREHSHSRKFSAAVKEVLKSLASVEEAATNLKEAIGRAWGSITRPAEQHGVRLSEQVLEACKSLAEHRPHISYEELRKFEERTLQVVRSITKTYNKYARSIIRTVKSETSILGDSITALNRSINDLSQLLDRSNLRQLQLLERDADQLVRIATELSLRADEVHKAKGVLRELQEREAKLQNDLSLLVRDQNIEELSRIGQEIMRRETETLALLEPLSKPLRKLDRPANKLPTGLNTATVSKLTEDPLTAVLEIPVSEMRALLDLLRGLIEREELFLDQRRKQKSIEAIQALQSGVLERFREDHSILQANRQEVLRQLKSSGIYDQWLSLRKQSDDVRAEVHQCQSHITDLQSQETRLRTVVVADKARIEAALQNVLNEQVSIVV